MFLSLASEMIILLELAKRIESHHFNIKIYIASDFEAKRIEMSLISLQGFHNVSNFVSNIFRIVKSWTQLLKKRQFSKKSLRKIWFGTEVWIQKKGFYLILQTNFTTQKRQNSQFLFFFFQSTIRTQFSEEFFHKTMKFITYHILNSRFLTVSSWLYFICKILSRQHFYTKRSFSVTYYELIQDQMVKLM